MKFHFLAYPKGDCFEVQCIEIAGCKGEVPRAGAVRDALASILAPFIEYSGRFRPLIWKRDMVLPGGYVVWVVGVDLYRNNDEDVTNFRVKEQ